MTQQNSSQALRLSFEYFPVQSPEAQERLSSAISRHSVFSPDFVSVTYGAGGTSQERTLTSINRIKSNTNLDVAGHLTTVGGAREHVLNVADQYREAGVNRIVALRGDKPKGAERFEPVENGFASSLELIEALKAKDFDVSVSAYPEKHPDALDDNADVHFLKEKFARGADRAITQYFFEKTTFLRFLDRAEKLGIDKPIIPGILPIENFDKVKNFSAACGANIPAWLADAYRRVESPETHHLLSVALACELIENLRAEGVDHFHIYTLNNPELTYDICTALGLRANQPQFELVA